LRKVIRSSLRGLAKARPKAATLQMHCAILIANASFPPLRETK
jgi:hypothetical protein